MYNLDLGLLLHKAAMLIKCDLTSRLDQLGLTNGQYSVIKDVYENSNNDNILENTPASISARLSWERATVSEILDRLETQGWIRKITNPQDKRSYIVKLTKKTLDSIGVIYKIKNDHYESIIKGFNEEEINILRDFILRIINNQYKE